MTAILLVVFGGYFALVLGEVARAFGVALENVSDYPSGPTALRTPAQPH